MNGIVETDAIPVHVMNPDAFVFRTEEREPEHFSFFTMTVQPPAALANQGQGPQLLLAEDPLRKDASLVPVDGPIVLCHSPQQAAAPGNQLTGFTAPDGAYVAQGQSVSLTGTGRVYVTCQTATRVSVIQNRRGA